LLLGRNPRFGIRPSSRLVWPTGGRT